MLPPLIISVVRDFAMYGRCLAENPFLAGCERRVLDNRARNEAIPILYNRVLDQLNLNEDRWLVFAHEDFEPMAMLAAALAPLDTRFIWGPIGAKTVSRWPWFFGGYRQGRIFGQIESCWKDESHAGQIGTAVPLGTEVETLDCMFLAVSTSRLRETGLRFDEHLTFDLYAEDFSMQARFRHGIGTRIFPFPCRHHSGGTIAPRFHAQRRHLKAKYPHDIAVSTTSYFLGGGGGPFWRLQILIRDRLPR